MVEIELIEEEEESTPTPAPVNDNDIPSSLQALDEFTSPIHNPAGVCISFNLVFFALFLSLAALVYLGESKPAVFLFFLASAALWILVNLFLCQLSSLTADAANNSPPSPSPHPKQE